jgi:hypothetical protein
MGRSKYTGPPGDPPGPKASTFKDRAEGERFAAPPSHLLNPSPHSFGTVFLASAFDSAHEVQYSPDFQALTLCFRSFVENVGQTETFQSVVTNSSSDAATRARVETELLGTLFASAFLATAQSVCQSHLTVSGTLGDASAVTMPDTLMPINLRVIADLVGELNLHDGRMMRLQGGHMGVVSSLVRAAGYVMEQGWGVDTNSLIMSMYYPARRSDSTVEVVMSEGCRKVILRHAAAPPGLQVNASEVYGDMPGYLTTLHAAIPFPAADWSAIEFFYGNQPVENAQWNVPSFWTLVTAVTGLPMPEVFYCSIERGLAYKATASQLATKLAQFLPRLNRIFHLGDSTLHKGRTGAITQLAEVATTDIAVTLRSDYLADSSSLSLAGIYHVGIHCNLYQNRERAGVIWTNKNQVELRMKFSNASVKEKL